MSEAPDLLWDGEPSAAVTVLLAPGAGAPCRSPFLVDVAQGLAKAGLRVARFDFPYMQGERPRRAPDPMPKLQQCLRLAAAATGAPPGQLVLAGKSMGGRVATMLADELGAAGVVVFGYPFHPPRQPDKLRTAHLQTLRTRCLILQGERDPFGTPQEIAGYALAAAVAVEFLPDGDHSLQPRRKSGIPTTENLAHAIGRAAAFARDVAAG